MASRLVEVVIARAIHHAMTPGFDAECTARELVALSQGSRPVLLAALLRVDRALNERWSSVASHASDALRSAVEAVPVSPQPWAA